MVRTPSEQYIAINWDNIGWIKRLFPEFEFTWLGSEMRENLPKEMDFQHEAYNAQRAEEDFKNIRTALYIRKFSLVLDFDEVGIHAL